MRSGMSSSTRKLGEDLENLKVTRYGASGEQEARLMRQICFSRFALQYLSYDLHGLEEMPEMCVLHKSSCKIDGGIWKALHDILLKHLVIPSHYFVRTISPHSI